MECEACNGEGVAEEGGNGEDGYCKACDGSGTAHQMTPIQLNSSFLV